MAVLVVLVESVFGVGGFVCCLLWKNFEDIGLGK